MKAGNYKYIGKVNPFFSEGFAYELVLNKSGVGIFKKDDEGDPHAWAEEESFNENFELIAEEVAPGQLDSCDQKMTDHDVLEDLAYNQLTQRVKYFTQIADDLFHKGVNDIGGYNLMVAERYMNELKIRMILTAI